MFIHGLVIGACLIGTLIASYFTLVYYRLLKPDARFVPRFCRMDGNTCFSILSTREARIFGAPNSLYGVSYYVGILVCSFLPYEQHIFLWQLAGALSVGTVVISGYLLFALLVKLKIKCVLCITGHAVNVMLMMLLLIQLSSK